MINPSELNLSTLPWLPLEAKSAFPSQPAIYFAIDAQNTIQYIGRSVNPKIRWSGHHKHSELQEIGSIRIAYLFVDLPELLPEIESALIDWFDPLLNVAGKTSFGEQLGGCHPLKELRDRAGLTQKQVADAMNITVQTVSNWENGVRFPRLTPGQTLVLCRTLKCTLEELAGDQPRATKGSDD